MEQLPVNGNVSGEQLAPTPPKRFRICKHCTKAHLGKCRQRPCKRCKGNASVHEEKCVYTSRKDGLPNCEMCKMNNHLTQECRFAAKDTRPTEASSDDEVDDVPEFNDVPAETSDPQ